MLALRARNAESVHTLVTSLKARTHLKSLSLLEFGRVCHQLMKRRTVRVDVIRLSALREPDRGLQAVTFRARLRGGVAIERTGDDVLFPSHVPAS